MLLQSKNFITRTSLGWRKLKQNSFGGGGGIDPQAQAHYDRVIADGGIMPAGLLGCNAWFVAVKAVYAVTDITTAISAGYDPHYLGAKIGAGSGTTLGQAASKLYSCSGASGDLVQATAASMPLLLVKNSSDANYWFGSGVSGNYCSTPNAVANQITGDIEMVAKISISDASGEKTIIAKRAGASASYVFSSTSNLLRFRLNTTTYDSNASYAFAENTIFWGKVTRQQSSGDIKFYTSTDGITWTQLGTTISGITVAIDSYSIPVTIGLLGDLNSYPMKGKIYKASLSNSIGGTPVVDYNPASYNAATSQTSWVSATSEVWTINTGTATTGYKGVLVDRTILQGDGVDDGLVTSGTITLSAAFTIYGAFKGYNNEGGSGKSVFGKSNIDGNIFRRSAFILSAWIGHLGSAIIDQTGISTTSNLNLATFKRKVNNNTLQVNNGTATNNTASTVITQSALSLFSVTTYGSSNALFTSGIISTLEDDTTQKTAMYNYLRSTNNNAF